MEHPKFIWFDGKKYRLSGNYYSCDNWGTGTKLHRAIWEKYTGQSIPDGYHIHHIDGNTFNNDISNLVCVSEKEHLSLHAQKSKWVGSEENKQQLIKAQELAKKWHASEEGHKWHSEHGKKCWEKRIWCKAICTVCGKEYTTPYPTRSKYCSDKCKAKFNNAKKKKKTLYTCIQSDD